MKPDLRRADIVLPAGRLEAAWWGLEPDSAPTLVLLHEGLGCVALWRDFPARLAVATGCGVFAYSRLGYGRSDSTALPRPLDYMHREAVEVLPGVLDAVGVRRCVLIGHSDGASIAAIHAGAVRDERVRGLVLLAPHFFVEDATIASIAAIRGSYPGNLRTRLARYHDDVDTAFLGWAEAWLDPGFPAALDLAREVGVITVPTLILQGENDPYGTMAQARFAERLSLCRVRTVSLNCGHAPFIEAPAATDAAIGEFVPEVLGTSA